MSVVESFSVDHTKMAAPAVRLSKRLKTPSGDILSVFDLRMCKPNCEMMDGKGLHTLEHLLAGFIRDALNSGDVEVIDISPMGCRTGYYLSVIGKPSEEKVADGLTSALKRVSGIQSLKEVPGVNVYQCGSWEYQDLDAAKSLAAKVVSAGIGVNRNEDLLLDPALLGE